MLKVGRRWLVVNVSAPGYLSAQVLSVVGGQGGCVAYSAPSQVLVDLPRDGSGGPVDAN